MTNPYPRIARLRDAETFQNHLESLGIDIPFDELLISGSESPLAKAYTLPNGFTIGNRFCTLPMEGWDGTRDGKPSQQTIRRWQHFGRSGAKLIWGGEAVAVRHDGRANPNQLLINNKNQKALQQLRQALVKEHEAHYGSTNDLLMGLQLTHSGRFSRPNVKTRLEPKIVYHHPLIDDLFNIPQSHPIMTDSEIEEIHPQVPDWHVIEVDGIKRLERVYKLKNFIEAIAFTNKIGLVAEKEDHHPVIVTEYGRVTVSWWTHIIKGLHKND